MWWDLRDPGRVWYDLPLRSEIELTSSQFVKEVTKSSLIKVGPNLQPHTANVQAIRCELTDGAKADLDAIQKNIVFVDTPSFHTGVDDEAAEKEMKNWLSKSK